jgi:hypothetical protein
MEEHSKNSVITAMNQFLSSVDEMDSTVLVPRRLMDIPAVQLQRTHKDDKEILEEDIDLFKFYTMLVETRDEIKWGGRAHTEDSSSVCPIVQQLQQFSRVLNDLTDMAVQLKERYEYDVNNTSSAR